MAEAQIVKLTPDSMLTHVEIIKHQEVNAKQGITRDLNIYFKTVNLMLPIMLAQKSHQYPDHVALYMSITPSFISFNQPLSRLSLVETVEEETPDSSELPSVLHSKTMYVFIVDRSGSMSGPCIQLTKQALALFVKSLPADSRFDIISFGFEYKAMSGTPEGYMYEEETVESVL